MMSAETNPLFKLSPSDLTFLWDECPRCFYLKIAKGFNRPATAFPSIFSKIDRLMKDFFTDKPTSEITYDLPAGRVKFGEKWVFSLPISFPGKSTQVYIRGKFDTLVEFEDGTYGVIDFKTSEPKPSHVQFYGRQLHAYAYALEQAAPGKLKFGPISRLGLLVVAPAQMIRTQEGGIAYVGEVTWLEVPRNDALFLDFLTKVVSLLELPEPPAAHPKCGFCNYRQAAREIPW
jgi:hypothetical protein